MTFLKRRINFICVLSAVVFIGQMSTGAQTEIPQSIKDMLSNGIAIIDSAKGPKDIEKAVDLFKNAARLEPKSPEAHFYLGKTLQLLNGNIRNAIREYEKYLSLSPNAADKEDVEKEITGLKKSISTNADAWRLGFRYFTLHDDVFVWHISNPAAIESDNIKSSLYPGDKIVKINGMDIHKSNINEAIKSILDGAEVNAVISVLRGSEQLSMSIKKRTPREMSEFESIGEADINELIASAKTPLIIYWMKKRDMVCLQYSKLLAVMSSRSADKISVVEVDLDINKMLNDEFGISYENVPAALVYENGKLTLSAIGKGEITKLSMKVRELTN